MSAYKVTNTPQYDHLFKFIIVGDSGVGKSCLMIRFADNQFTGNFITTIGVDFRFRSLSVDDQIAKVQIWDTAGADRFKTVTKSYYRNAHAVMVVFDVSDKRSFSNLDQWLFEIDRYAPTNVSKMIVGNKCDMINEDRQISPKEGAQYAEKLGIPYFETSAKTAGNVDDAFYKMVRILIEKKKNELERRASSLKIAQNEDLSGCTCLIL